MSKESGPKTPELPPIYEVDVSDGWDTVAKIEIFLDQLKKLSFYRPGLLYSGFGATEIGKKKSTIFAAKEEAFGVNYRGTRDPFDFARDYEDPVIGVYDPAYLDEEIAADQYRIKDPKAIVAIIKIKGEMV